MDQIMVDIDDKGIGYEIKSVEEYNKELLKAIETKDMII
jgi:hypothetical protein